jgi:hypothetical protein
MPNFTLPVPDGTVNHGDKKLICIPPQWYQYLVFFLANYVAHAATLFSYPGQSLGETVFVAVNALFLPGSGALRAARLLVTHSGTIRGMYLGHLWDHGVVLDNMWASTWRWYAAGSTLVGISCAKPALSSASSI